MRYWHLLLGSVFVFLAAQIDIGVPGAIARPGRWGALFGVAAVGAWTLFTADRLVAYPTKTGGIPTSIVVLLWVFIATALSGFAVLISFLKWVLLITEVFVFVYAANRLLTIRQWYQLAQTLFLLLAGVMGIVFLAAVTGFSLIPTRWPPYVQGRVAVLGNPNSIGLVALIAAIFALWATRWPLFSVSWKKWIPRGGLAISLLVLTWTASRTSLAAFVIGAIVWAAYTRRLKWGIALGALLGTVVGIGSIDASTLDFAGVIVERLQGDTLMDSRDQVWSASLRNWKDYPWFGHGYGVTEGGYAMGGISGATGSVRDGSGYFGVLESVGVMGVGALLILYGVLARNLFRGVVYGRAITDQWADRDLAFFGMSLFFALAVHASGEPWLLGPGGFPHVVFWLAVGLTIAGMRYRSGAFSSSGDLRMHGRASRQEAGIASRRRGGAP